MRPRRFVVVCLLGGCLFLGGGLVLSFDNLAVDVSASDMGDHAPARKVECSIAPWDAGLNNNDDGPGGEHSSPYFDEVATECSSANATRFKAALGSGAFGLLTLSVGVVAAVRSRWPAHRRWHRGSSRTPG